MKTRIWAALAGGTMLLGGAGANAQPTGDAGANWDAVIQCAKLSGAPARHSCIDQLLRDKGVLDSQREQAEARQSFGQDRRVETKATPPQTAAAAPVIASPAQVAATPPPPAPSTPPELKSLQTQITGVRIGADRMLVITTAEGAVWRQTQTIDMRFPPEKGDAIEIERGALGGHRCKLGSKIFGCQRVG